MDKNQAEAAARSILEPELRKQHERAVRLRAKKGKFETRQRRHRVAVWFILVGAAVGVAVAYFTGQRFTQGVIWGGTIGGLVGWTVAFFTVRAVAA